MTRFLLDTHAIIHWQIGAPIPPALAGEYDVMTRWV